MPLIWIKKSCQVLSSESKSNHIPSSTFFKGLFTGDLRLITFTHTSIASFIAVANATLKCPVAFSTVGTCNLLHKHQKNGLQVMAHIKTYKIIHTCMHAHTHACTHACTHARTHTHTHTHTLLKLKAVFCFCWCLDHYMLTKLFHKIKRHLIIKVFHTLTLSPLTLIKFAGPPSLGGFEPAALYTGCFTWSTLMAKLFVWKATKFHGITG